MPDEYRYWPASDPRRIGDAMSSYWNRAEYERIYGQRAMMAMDACRSAARHKDMKAMVEAARRLDNALRRDRPMLYGR